MKAVWVLENFKDSFSISSIELRVFLTSVVQWKRFYPDSEAVLFCTRDVFTYLRSLGADSFWDSVDSELLETGDGVDRNRFWTAGKYKVMRTLEAPFVLMDCDLFLVEKIGEEAFEKDLIVSHLEQEEFYHYFWQKREIFESVGIERPAVDSEGKAWNVSFFYVREQRFKDLYIERAWDWMERLSKYEGEEKWQNSFMLFCEQKLLYDLSLEEGIRVHCLKRHLSDENPVHLGEEKRREDLKLTHLPFREKQARAAVLGSGKEEVLEEIIRRVNYDGE